MPREAAPPSMAAGGYLLAFSLRQALKPRCPISTTPPKNACQATHDLGLQYTIKPQAVDRWKCSQKTVEHACLKSSPKRTDNLEGERRFLGCPCLRFLDSCFRCELPSAAWTAASLGSASIVTPKEDDDVPGCMHVDPDWICLQQRCWVLHG